MDAIHIDTLGMYCEDCPLRIQQKIECLPGVKAVCAYRALHLTSVLYDPAVIEADAIRCVIENEGFTARVVSGSASR